MHNPFSFGSSDYKPELVISLPCDKAGNPAKLSVTPKLKAVIVLLTTEQLQNLKEVRVIHNFGETAIHHNRCVTNGLAVAIYGTMGQLNRYLFDNHAEGIWTVCSPELNGWEFLKPYDSEKWLWWENFEDKVRALDHKWNEQEF